MNELKIEVENISGHESRDQLHAHYVAQLFSTPEARQSGFRQLIKALSRCKGAKEIGTLTEVMSQENFKTLLRQAPACLAYEMPPYHIKVEADCAYSLTAHTEEIQRQFNQSFEDCLILYLAIRLSPVTEHELTFYREISEVLAQKGYYYQNIAARNADYPVDALDYGWLGDSNSVLDYYAEGALQIAVEHHYQAGISVLQLAEAALNALDIEIRDATVREISLNQKIVTFLEQFDLLLKVSKMALQYSHPLMPLLEQKCQDYLRNPTLPALFSRIFGFQLRHHQTKPALLKNECEPLLSRMNAWSQYAPENAITALGTFGTYLDARRLTEDDFYNTAKEQLSTLLLRLRTNQPAAKISPKALPDLNALAIKTFERYKALLTINQNLNTSSIALLQKQITAETDAILKPMFSAIEDILGEAPCAFSILGLGSYSREEMSLCSDIDFAILVSDESSAHHPYFKSFMSLLVHLRRPMPPRVFGIDSKDLQNLYGRETSLVHTPEHMVLAHCPFYTETELKGQEERLTNESYSIRRASLLYNSQSQLSQTLYQNYQQALTDQLETLDPDSSLPYYQRIGQACFIEDFTKKMDRVLVNIRLSPDKHRSFNFKETHLRPLTLWVLNAATYFGIKENNIWAILKALNQSRLSPLFLKELEEALTYLHTLRLKLHHAWLTETRPAELLFDTCLEMPTNKTIAASARDFYLDATQQNTLDAIERRIIEPLRETVSAFGTVLPPPHFDPAAQYFEQQFVLKAVDSKEISESRLKWQTLSEIAVRRPALLAPTPVFRDLALAHKIAYLDGLDVGLEAIKQKGSVKEMAELNALVKTLWHFPLEDGWRAESFKQERIWHQQLMRLISTEVSAPASNTLSLVQDKKLKHYVLKSEIISQLFTEQGEWVSKDTKISGNHLVYAITDKNQRETLCWAKIYPEQPGIEWLMLNLDQCLGVYGIPYSTLVNIHHNGRNSAALLVAHVPHPNLLKTLQTVPQVLSHLDRAHFFKTLMRVLLTNPEDDKGDDYFLESQKDGLKLIRIDNERAFFASESVNSVWRTRKLQVKSILYCLDLLIEPIETGNPNVNAAIRDFLRLKPLAVLKNLLLELKALHPLWKSLFSKADIEAHYHNKKPWLSLPILYVPQELVKELSVKMESLQTLLVLTPKTTGWELLNTVQPTLARHYLEGFRQYQNSQKPYAQVLARFNLSPGQHYKKQEQGLVSLHGIQAVTQSLRLPGALSLDVVKSIWQGKTYTADVVLAQIEHWEADRTKDIYNGLLHSDPTVQKKAYVGWQQLSNRQRVLLFKNFSEGVRKNSIADIRLQQAMLAALPSTTFHTLDLSAFSVSLEDKLLIPILKTGGAYLTELTLDGCQNLSEAIPGIIVENCPNLKILNISNMAWKSFSTRLGWSPVVLPKLEKLEMQNCRALGYFIIQAPKADINLQGCTALKHMQLSSTLASSSTIQPGECQYQLAKSYLLETGVLRNPMQAYYWARLSREHQYPFCAMLFYALFNFYGVTPINGIDESLAAEKAVVSLVGESHFASIQTLKNMDVKTLKLENITASAFTLLIFALAVNSTLQHLDLTANNIGDTGAAALSKALLTNSTLQHLDLTANNIGPTGVRVLSENLKTNITLRHLNLRRNPIGVMGTKALSKVLLSSSTLQHLDLSSNALGAMSATALGRALLVNSKLQYLNLSYNKIGDTGAAVFGEALLANSTLLGLNLENNGLSDNEGQKIVSQINDFLAKNRQNAQKQPPAQKPLPPTKPLEKKDDSTFTPVAFQYAQQSLNARRPSINSGYQYEDNDIQAILAARLQLIAENQNLPLMPIKILGAVDNMLGTQLENRLRQEAKGKKGARTLLIPCNLGDAHWAGLLLEFNAHEQIVRAEYLDSLKPIESIPIVPETFQIQLQKVYPQVYLRAPVFLLQSDSTSCGAYAIENLLTAALGIQSPKDGESIRQLHLEALQKHNLNFYKSFNERQRNNRPTTANLQEQLGYLDKLKGIWFSNPELNRILAIKQCLSRLPAETEAPLLRAFKPNPTHIDEHNLHLNIIRITLQDALKFESKNLAELMELLFENWRSEDSLTLDKLKFRVSYNEILAITQCHLAQAKISDLQQTLIEKIKQDEEFARKLQAELWCDGELAVSFHLSDNAEQYQASSSNEHTNTVSTAWVEPLTPLRRSNANASSQSSVVSTEEKQPRVLRERPKPVFKANTGDGL